MNKPFNRLCNRLNWQPITTLPWIKTDDWPLYSLPLGVVIRCHNGQVVLVGNALQDSAGYHNSSTAYYEWGDDVEVFPRLPYVGATEWAWINDALAL